MLTRLHKMKEGPAQTVNESTTCLSTFSPLGHCLSLAEATKRYAHLSCSHNEGGLCGTVSNAGHDNWICALSGWASAVKEACLGDNLGQLMCAICAIGSKAFILIGWAAINAANLS